MSQYNVRSSQTVAAAFFCLDAAARACLDPFVPIYLRHHALNALHTGAVIGVAAILAAALVPSLVWLPRWRRQGWRSILLASSALAVTCYIALLMVPPMSDQYQLASPCAQVHLKVPVTMTTIGLPSSSRRVHPTGHRATSARPTSSVGTSAKPSSPRVISAGTYEPMPTALPRVSATSAAPVVVLSTAQHNSSLQRRHHHNHREKSRSRIRREADGGLETTWTAERQTTVPTRSNAPLGMNSTIVPGSHGAGHTQPGILGKRRKKVLPPEHIPGTKIPVRQNASLGHHSEDGRTQGPNCDGVVSDPDCLSPPKAEDEQFDSSVLLLVTLIVICGEAMLSLAGLAADESYFRFLDEIDATEKTNTHRTHSAIVSAVVLGITAVVATQVPCLPLSTWGSSTEVYLLVFGALVSMSLPLAAFFPEPQQAVRRRTSSTGACRGVADALKGGEGALVGTTLVLLGALAGVEGTFFLWHLEEGGHSNALGAVVLARAVARVAALLLVKVGGLPGRLHGWLVFAVLCTSARCACYVQSGWQLAAMAQLLSPPSTVLLWFACERWARRTSMGIDAERCLLAVLSVCHRGIGMGVGAILGGVAVVWAGTRLALGLCAIVGIVGGAVVFTATRFVAPRPPSYDRLLWDPTSPNSDTESEEESQPLGRQASAVPDASS